MELSYAADCPEDGKVVFNEDFIVRFSEIFPGYTIQGLVLETDHFSPEILDAPGADVRSVRGMLGNREMRLSWKDGYTVFPAATEGNSMEDGNLFAVCSVLGAYGMVSHVFDVDMLLASDENTAVWDLDGLAEEGSQSSCHSQMVLSASWVSCEFSVTALVPCLPPIPCSSEDALKL